MKGIKLHGFKLKLFRHRSGSSNRRWNRHTGGTSHFSRLFHYLKKKTESLYSSKLKLPCISRKQGYIPLTGEKLPAAALAPKGHMVVYVGRKEEEKECDFQRFMIPVMYFNHPLFGKLLNEVEEEYGFNHPGGITIPCRVSEFESVQSRIAAAAAAGGCGGRNFLKWTKGL